MNNNNDKRSSTTIMKATTICTAGVGARHTDAPMPSRGGGYQDVCTSSIFCEKNLTKNENLRIDELREIGLDSKWIKIAEAIGFDDFMVAWAILDSDNISNSGIACDPVRIWVPFFKRYLRYQRNRYILSRAADNNPDAEDIQREIKNLLGESLSIVHIQRIMKKVNI